MGGRGLEGSQARLLATVHGGVQAVGFRDFVWRQAHRLRLTGYVRNLPDGASVEVQAEGEQTALQELVSLLWTGPTFARVTFVQVEWASFEDEFPDFSIQGSRPPPAGRRPA